MAKKSNKKTLILLLILLLIGGFFVWIMFLGGADFLSFAITGTSRDGDGNGNGVLCADSYPDCDGSCGSAEWCRRGDFSRCECVTNYPSTDCEYICANQPGHYDGGYKAHSGKDCEAGTFYEDGCCCYYDEDYSEDDNGEEEATLKCGCVEDDNCIGECEEYPGYTTCYEYYWFDSSYSACVCVMSGASSPLWWPGTENHHINEPLCRTKCAYAGYQNGLIIESWCEADPDWDIVGDCCCYKDWMLKLHVCPDYEYTVRGIIWFGDLDCERYADEFCEHYHDTDNSGTWYNEATRECCFDC